MDPSNRLECILKGYQAKAEDLSKDEWRAIITEALKICRPLLKHIDGFQTLGHYFGQMSTQNHHTAYDLIIWPREDIYDNERCLVAWESDKVRNKITLKKKIFLTQSGLWLLWKSSFQELATNTEKRRATYSEFKIISNPMDCPNAHKNLVGVDVLQALLKSLNDAIWKKKKWLNDLERTALQIYDLSTRTSA